MPAKCNFCKKRLSVEGNFAFLAGGAMLLDKHGEGGSDPKMQGYLDIGMHGAREGNSDDVMIALGLKQSQGQFEFMFCSTACLRIYLNEAVDRLETAASRKKAGGKVRGK